MISDRLGILKKRFNIGEYLVEHTDKKTYKCILKFDSECFICNKAVLVGDNAVNVFKVTILDKLTRKEFKRIHEKCLVISEEKEPSYQEEQLDLVDYVESNSHL